MTLLDCINSLRGNIKGKASRNQYKYCHTLSTMSNNKFTNTNYVQLHLEIPETQMDFISVDLTSTFKTTTKGNQYASTVVSMLTNYVICIPILDKSADIVVNAYLKEVYCRFGGRKRFCQIMEVNLKFIIFRSN